MPASSTVAESFAAPIDLQPTEWSRLSLSLHQAVLFVGGACMCMFPTPFHALLIKSLFIVGESTSVCWTHSSESLQGWGEALILLGVLLQPVKLTTDAFLRGAVHRCLVMFWFATAMNRVMAWPFAQFSFRNFLMRTPFCALMGVVAALPFVLAPTVHARTVAQLDKERAQVAALAQKYADSNAASAPSVDANKTVKKAA